MISRETQNLYSPILEFFSKLMKKTKVVFVLQNTYNLSIVISRIDKEQKSAEEEIQRYTEKF